MFKQPVYLCHAVLGLRAGHTLQAQVTLYYRGQKQTFDADLGVYNPEDAQVQRIKHAHSQSERYNLIWRLVQPQIHNEVEAWLQHVTYHADTIDAYAQLN